MTELKKSDDEIIANTHNLARYSVESRQVTWILLIVTLLWGIYGYVAMEKRKDPAYSNLFAVAICTWPGASAEKVEQLVTKKIEEKLSENKNVTRIQSVSRSNLAVVTVKIDDRLRDTDQQFDDLNLRLGSIQDLPNGAGPIRFMKDYDDITTLMLAVASPKAGDVELSLRGQAVEKAIRQARQRATKSQSRAERVSIIVCYPYSLSATVAQRQRNLFIRYASEHRFLSDIVPIDGNGFVGVDATCPHTDPELNKFIASFAFESLKLSHLHPDLWDPAIIHDPAATKPALVAVAGDKYSYAELDKYTDLIKRTLQALPQVSKIQRSGVLGEQINLEFSQERLASHGMQPTDLRERLAARNISTSGAVLEVRGKNLPIRPSGEFQSEKDLGGVLIGTSGAGAPVYLRDIVDISRDYENPPRFLGFLTTKDPQGNWQRTRAITLAVFMRNREHIDEFATAVNASLAELKNRLPDDLIWSRTADQPKQVEDNVDLFMMSLYEAVGLVIVTALIGFWEWRSALMIALSIPATLAMTAGLMFVTGINLQQCSIASLIISLGLLVDDPVVAGDAIKRALSEGRPRSIAAWLGPTKLAHAIMFATMTNIAAYLPLLMISGEIGQFIFSLPIVITLSLLASRFVSMSFVPLLGYYLLKPPKAKQEKADSVTTKQKIIEGYLRAGHWVLDHRIIVFGTSVVLLVLGFNILGNVKSSFFPNDEFDLCWVDVWLPEDAPLTATNNAAMHVERVARETVLKYARDHADKQTGKTPTVLDSLCTYVGGSGPRFWSTVVPELDQLNYGQVIVKVTDKHYTDELIPLLQNALSKAIPEARCDVRQLEGGKPIGIPVAVRISGSDQTQLRKYAASAVSIMNSCPLADRPRDDWGAGDFAVKLDINSDRANLAGMSNQDVADSAATGLVGAQVETLREGDKQIPIVARLRPDESTQIQQISDLYVYSLQSQQKVPLPELATISYAIETEKIRRRNQFRTITVGAFTAPGVLPSEVMAKIGPALQKLGTSMPPGYKLEIGGEQEEEIKSFNEMAMVMAVSVASIFLCLVLQFKNAIKPLLVFAGVPYGMLGALVGLTVMGQPFGFPAFMGVASLTGVIVSHVIVLFDFIEQGREEGMPLRDALLHSSMVRLRPVLITVAATVLGFIPLAAHGGPLWQPLCYSQIGGLTFATFVTLGLVPIIYAICVLDLKIISWTD
jgi:multidrug efflux pump subunit AcrB